MTTRTCAICGDAAHNRSYHSWRGRWSPATEETRMIAIERRRAEQASLARMPRTEYRAMMATQNRAAVSGFTLKGS